MDRIDLSKTFRGNVVELGVAAGKFSRSILQGSSYDTYYGIDKWNDHHDVEQYKKVVDKLSHFKNCFFLRMSFREALPLFPNEYFDTIYIDGYAREGQENGQTLFDWWDKLKIGGMFSGHDYCLEYHKTMEVVDLFSETVKIPFKLTKEENNYPPSWYMIKTSNAENREKKCLML